MRQILTDAACKTRPPRPGRLEIADLREAGLVLRVTTNGRAHLPIGSGTRLRAGRYAPP